MRDGFIRCAAYSTDVAVADPRINAAAVIEAVRRAQDDGVNLLCFPRLSLTGVTCGDLFFCDALVSAAEEALFKIAESTADTDVVFALGLPLRHFSKLYDCAAVIHSGEILGIIPSSRVHGADSRYFSDGEKIAQYEFHRFSNGTECSIGADLLFSHESLANFTFGVVVDEDPHESPLMSAQLCRKGAKIILDLSASAEIVGALESRRSRAMSLSAHSICACVTANAKHTESTGDAVYGAHNMIYENGTLISEVSPFEKEAYTFSEVDVDRLASERSRTEAFSEVGGSAFTVFSQLVEEKKLTRHISENPFVPVDRRALDERCELILSVQAHGLAKRIRHTRASKLVLGVSGGLDSTLAMLVCVKALDLCGCDRTDLIAVTMPCFGTTARTKSNAQKLCESLGASFREVNISDSVRSHFADIGHDEAVHDVTYENCQARERTQVIMDIANAVGGLVVGTGDLSELALGWCTYNGDQMSMYGVNGGVPKTLIRHIVAHEAELAEARCELMLSETLTDILDTPVSPELLPPDDSGDILQKTEDIVGPYELHDFFLYYTVRFGFGAAKIYRLAAAAYEGAYSDRTIRKWLDTFMRRFVTQQFKRSCMPDGVKVGSVSLSPRGEWCMPSDAVGTVFQF